MNHRYAACAVIAAVVGAVFAAQLAGGTTVYAAPYTSAMRHRHACMHRHQQPQQQEARHDQPA